MTAFAKSALHSNRSIFSAATSKRCPLGHSMARAAIARWPKATIILRQGVRTKRDRCGEKKGTTPRPQFVQQSHLRESGAARAASILTLPLRYLPLCGTVLRSFVSPLPSTSRVSCVLA
jgi:hypothetical protein